MRGAARRAALGAAATAAAAALAGCLGEREPAWAGTIVREGGTTVVRNPVEPLLPDSAVRSERVWVVPEDALDERSAGWRRPHSILVEGDTAFVLDVRARQVHVVALDGRWQRSFGREGGGPGEFRSPSSLVRLGDSLGVLDSRKGLLLFGWSGTPGRLITFDEPTFDARSLGDGSVFVSTLGGLTERRWLHVRPGGVIDSFPLPRLGPPIAPRLGASDTACRQLAITGGQVLQYGCTKPVVIDVDSVGRARLQLEFPNSEPPRVTEAARDSFRRQAAEWLVRAGQSQERAEMLATLQANAMEHVRFWGARREPRTGLYVLWEQESSAAGAPGALLHVFSPDGIYLARHRFPEPWRVLELVEGDLLVSSTDAETGLERLARYRLHLPDDALARAAAVAVRAAPRDQS